MEALPTNRSGHGIEIGRDNCMYNPTKNHINLVYVEKAVESGRISNPGPQPVSTGAIANSPPLDADVAIFSSVDTKGVRFEEFRSEISYTNSKTNWSVIDGGGRKRTLRHMLGQGYRFEKTVPRKSPIMNPSSLSINGNELYYIKHEAWVRVIRSNEPVGSDNFGIYLSAYLFDNKCYAEQPIHLFDALGIYVRNIYETSDKYIMSAKRNRIEVSKIRASGFTLNNVWVREINDKLAKILDFELEWKANDKVAVFTFPMDISATAPSDKVGHGVLAEQYGRNSYTTKDQLLRAELVEIIARTIYGEQTKSENQAQHAVAWLIANRTLAQRKGEFTDGSPTSLFSVTTSAHMFTALEKEGGNLNSFTQKSSSDEGWVNAVFLANELVDVFENYYTGHPLSATEKNSIRQTLMSKIGDSPIGNKCWYVASYQWERRYTTQSGKHYYGAPSRAQNEIYSDFQDFGGNVFYNYTYVSN